MAQEISRQFLASEAGFDARSFHVGFTVGKLALEQDHLQLF
jgi:hypothetical protein